MKTRIVVLGAGFGGLELTTLLSDALPDQVEITLIDKSDAFVFGFSKLDVMFGRTTLDKVRLPYANILKPAVTFKQETITAIDPKARRVTTTGGEYQSDYLVVALGADYEPQATPGLLEGGNEFYSVAGAAKLRDILPTFTRGKAIVGVCSAPFKCPPAPSEAALLLHDFLLQRGHRQHCDITLVIPFGTPIPPSPDTSQALLKAFQERGIRFIASHRVQSLDPARHVAILDDNTELPFDLFLGIPKHRVPEVVTASGLTVEGWIPANRRTLETPFPGVYAIGDVTAVGTPKAGVFAEGAAKTVAARLIASITRGQAPQDYAGTGACYVEFGAGQVGRVDVDFYSGPKPTGTYQAASIQLVEEKKTFGASRRKRWFGL